MSLETVAIVGSILSLNLDQVVVGNRPSLLRGVNAFPTHVLTPRHTGPELDNSEASLTPLLFPSLVSSRTNISMDEYRQKVHVYFMALQEQLRITFQHYMGSVQPNLNNRGVKFHYILYYVPPSAAESTTVEVRPELDDMTTWSRLDHSGLQRKLDAALSTLPQTFTDKPYTVESAGKLMNIVDPTEYEVLLAALTKINMQQQDRDEWHVPLLDISNAVAAQDFQIEMFKKDDERRRQDQSKTHHNGTATGRSLTLSDELNEMQLRFRRTENQDFVKMSDKEAEKLISDVKPSKGEERYLKTQSNDKKTNALLSPGPNMGSSNNNISSDSQQKSFDASAKRNPPLAINGAVSQEISDDDGAHPVGRRGNNIGRNGKRSSKFKKGRK